MPILRRRQIICTALVFVLQVACLDSKTQSFCLMDSRNFGSAGGAAPCRACSEFKTWAKSQGKQPPKTNSPPAEEKEHPVGTECPLDKEDLGRSTWGFLHTMAAYYPDQPSDTQQTEMKDFFRTFSQFYPCHICAEHFRKDIQTSPPNVNSATELSLWLCRMHNGVNRRLGKPEFDCSRVKERWKDGWKDGSCD